MDTLVNDWQCSNTLSPMDFVPSRIEALVKLVQLRNAHRSIECTSLGITISFRLVQPLYLQPIITQYFIDNKSEIWLLFLIAHSKR